MNEEKKFNINLPAEASNLNNGKLDITFREDTANEIKVQDERKKVSLTLLLVSVSTFITKYMAGAWDKAKALITYSLNPDSLTFDFYSNPNEDYGIVAKSSLKKHKDLLAWNINNDQVRVNQREFIALIRRKGFMFETPGLAETLIKDLQNFEVKFDTTLKKADDRQGNKEDAFKETLRFVKGELPKQFTLFAPLYEGTESTKIVVDLEVDKGPQGSPVFSFFSLTLEEQYRAIGTAAILTEVDKFKDEFTAVEVA